MRSSEPTYAECLALITFTDDYLQPGLIKHNRPLFISGYLNGLEITRIMIDGGSAVNLLPLRMLKRLGIAIPRSPILDRFVRKPMEFLTLTGKICSILSICASSSFKS